MGRTERLTLKYSQCRLSSVTRSAPSREGAGVSQFLSLMSDERRNSSSGKTRLVFKHAYIAVPEV
jgi:hypothetical protein